MKKSAYYVLSAYSFISTENPQDILTVGYKYEGGNPIPSFEENVLIELCSEAQQTLSREKNLLQINGNVIIAGDIHGSLHDLLRIINFAIKEKSKVLFLGDYVDRGSFSLECVTILFALKVAYPDSFFLIRGNHEYDSICCRYGFKNEILSITKSQSLDLDQEQINLENVSFENQNICCYKYTEKLYSAFIRVFSYLPVAAIVNNTNFCIHGGLSPKLYHADDINEFIQRPIFDFESNSLLTDLVWSDPEYSSNYLFDLNPRGRGYLFNGDSIINFLRTNSFSRMIRGHQCITNGFNIDLGGKCITVFSASSYDKKIDNPSSILQLFQKNDTFKISTFPPIKRLQKEEAFYYKVQSLNEKKNHSCLSLLHPALRPSGSVKIFTNINLNQSRDILSNKKGSQASSSLLMRSKLIANRKKSKYVPLIPMLFNDENENRNEKINKDDLSSSTQHE